MSAQEGVSLKKCSRGGLRKRGIAAREALKEEERALLHCLPDILGRYDAPGQAESLACFQREVERCIARGREELRSMSRVYGALGVTAGGFLALMLL